MLARLDDAPRPEAFGGKRDALISPFFKAIAGELDGSPAERAIAVKNVVKRRFMRTRMSHMFALTDTQFDSVLIDVGADTTWRPHIENLAQMTFTKSSAPPSATFAHIQPSDRHHFGGHGVAAGAVVETKENTLSDELGAEQVVKLMPPEFIWALVELMDPVNESVCEKQMTKICTELMVWLFCLFGKWNIGVAIIRRLARMATVRFPNVKAKSGSWEKTLKYKSQCLSRKDASVSAKRYNSEPSRARPRRRTSRNRSLLTRVLARACLRSFTTGRPSSCRQSTCASAPRSELPNTRSSPSSPIQLSPSTRSRL